MSVKIKDVVIVGFDPAEMDATKGTDIVKLVHNGLNSSIAKLKAKGYTVELTYISSKNIEQAVQDTRKCLTENSYKVIVIGAGVRAIPASFHYFEAVINVVHELAPRSKIAFNQDASSSFEAAERWL